MKVKYWRVLSVMLYSTSLALVAKKPNKHFLLCNSLGLLILIKTRLAPMVCVISLVVAVEGCYVLDFPARFA